MLTQFDEHSQKIQNENKKQLGFIYNVISTNAESYIIIATVASLHNNIHRNFLKSLDSMGRTKLINYLLTYFFFNNDNVVIEPKWFEQLSVSFKTNLIGIANLQVGHYGETCGLANILEFSNHINISNIYYTQPTTC